MDRPEGNATRLLLDFESRCDPFRHLVRGYSLWTALRFHVWEGLKISLGDLSPRRAGSSASGRVARLRAGLNEWRTERSLAHGRRRCDVLALTSTSRLRDREGSVWRNTYYDYVDEPLPPALYYYIDSMSDRTPFRAESSVFVSARAHGVAIARMRRSGFEGHDASVRLHESFADFLGREWPAVAPPVSLDVLVREAERFVARYDAFRGVLTGTGTSVVLSDCYYDRTWAVAAARSLGIPVLELQHGIVYDGHVAYQFDPGTVAAHRHTLPVPDRVLSFGPQSSAIFSRGSAWGRSEVLDTGFPRMEYQQREYTWRAPQADAPLVVLVSAQWILTSHLRAFLSELTALLTPGIVIRVKPHPLDAEAAYAGIDGISVGSPQRDFYEALRGVHVHASVFSTTLMESIGLGVPTIVLGLPGAENADAVLEKGAGRRVDTPTELAALLEHCRTDPALLSSWQSESVSAARQFWAPNPGANMRRHLEAAVSSSD